MNINIFSQVVINPSDLDIPQTALGQNAVANDATVNNVLELVFGIGAGVAMIVIIVAGIQFILSRGDPEKSAKARRSVIYASIGLVLCALAFTIVRFVVRSLA